MATRLAPSTAGAPAPAGADPLPGGIGVGRRSPMRRRIPLLPALLYVVVVTQLPFVVTLYYSFQEWNLLRPGQRRFAGFENYQFILTSGEFRTAAWNTAVLTTSAVLVALLLGLGLALLLNRRFVGQPVARTLLITPFLIMPTTTALMWKNMMLNPSFGLVSFLARPFAGTVDWVAQYPMASVVAAVVWQWTPFMMLILLAGLQSQDQETMEAARVDGAGPANLFRYMTIPHLRPYLELAVLLGSVFIVQTFDPIFMITQGGPGQATTNLTFFTFLEAFRALDVGQAAAAGVVVVVITIVIATFSLRVLSTVFRMEAGR